MSLIIDARTRSLWNSAQTRPEWAATRFWEFVLKDQFFTGRDWTLSSQQPPTDDWEDRRRTDIRIERWTSKGWQTIAFFEAKKQRCTLTEVDELEYQAYNACMAHLIGFNREEMYAITTIGTAARLWYVTKKDDYLLPLVPVTTGLSDPAEYIEANSTMATELKEGLNHQLQSNIADPPPQPLYGLGFVYRPLPEALNPPLYSGASGPQNSDYAMPGVPDDNDDDGGGNNTMENSGPVAELDSETAVYVDVTRKVITHMTRPSEVLFCFEGRQTTKKHWKPSTITYQGTIVPCVVYRSSKGTNYYTYALPEAKGKGKA